MLNSPIRRLVAAAVLAAPLVVLAQVDGRPAVKPYEPTFQMGKVKVGKPVTHTFAYANVGLQPVLLSGATTSQGSAIKVSYPPGPINPGKKGEVTVTFTPAKPGPYSATITVMSNTPPVQLHIAGIVVAR